jgi:hypothetical protein
MQPVAYAIQGGELVKIASRRGTKKYVLSGDCGIALMLGFRHRLFSASSVSPCLRVLALPVLKDKDTRTRTIYRGACVVLTKNRLSRIV